MKYLINKLKILRDTIVAYIYYYKNICNDSINEPSIQDKRILLLVGDFAPTIAGGVYRPAALAKYSSLSGWDVTVLAKVSTNVATQAGLSLLEYIGSFVTIKRYHKTSLTPSVRLFPHLDGGLLTVFEIIKEAYSNFQTNIPRTVIASGPPFSSFVAGYYLTRDKNRRLILDYRDEWTECPFDFVSKSSNDINWEKKCLTRADLIIVTTQSQRAHLAKKFGNQIINKCNVIPNGWEPATTTKKNKAKQRKQHTKITLTFAGKLGGHTNPTQFLLSLSKILKRRPDFCEYLHLKFVGTKTDSALNLLNNFDYPELIECIPVVPLTTATKIMSESSILLLFHDLRFQRYLPGKIYDYIASGIPVMLFDDSGESKKLIKGLELGWCLSSDDDLAIESIIKLLIENMKDQKILFERNTAKVQIWLERHTREVLTKKFIELL